MSSNINATGVLPAPISERALALMKKALGDIKSGRLSGQLPSSDNYKATMMTTAAGDEATAKEAGLRRRAEQLLHRLASNGALPSAKALAELEAIVAEYFGPGLLGWLQPGETLASKRLKVDVRSQNGSVHSVDCDLAGSVQDLRLAVAAKLGGATPQLLCNGRPMSDEKQALYDWCARDGLGLRAGVAIVQEVARNVGG